MQPLLLLAVAAVLLPTAPSAGPVPSLTVGDGLDFTYGCYPDDPGTWICEFMGQVFDPTLLFFRWDLGGGPMGTWRTDFHLTIRYDREGAWRVCLQGWDGTSSKGGRPLGPVVCHGLALGGTLFVLPARWTSTSIGRASAIWTPPSGYARTAGQPTTAALYARGTPNTAPAIPLPCWVVGHQPRVCVFHLDRSTVTSAFGPGSHIVFMSGEWSDGRFFTLPAPLMIAS